MSDESKIRILVADDHPITREGLALILDNQTDMAVVAQANDGREALELFRQHRPDVAILDVQMPRMGGAEATDALLREFPGSRVILFTTYDGDEDIHRGMHAGARGYLLKDSPRDEVLRAIRAVHAGKRYLSPQAGALLADRMAAPHLTERELEILRLVAEGKANKEIAAVLGVTEGTVKSHVSSITAKLGVSGRTEAALEAVRRGFLRQ
jgi:two-component system, NarL family, response regulator